MNSYTIIIEKTETGYSAYAPDLPGCITVGDTKVSTRQNMKEAIALYLEELKNEGKPYPESRTTAETVGIA